MDPLLRLLVILGSKNSYDTDAAAYFAAMPTALSTAEKSAVDAFIRGLKTDSLWTPLDGGNILCLGTAAQCYIDFKVPSRVAVAAPGFTSTFIANRGFTGSGAIAGNQTDYIEPPFIPSSAGGQWTQNSVGMFAMSHTAAASSGFEIGANGTNDTYIRFRSADLMICRSNNGGNLATVANTDGSGFHGISRIAVDDTRYFREGVQLGATITTASAGLPDVAMRYLQPQAVAGTTRQLSFGCYGGGLSTAQVALLNTRVQTLTAALRAI